MDRTKVFIGYDAENDKTFKDRLLAWDTAKEFDFTAYDRPTGIAVDSEQAAGIKQHIAACMDRSTHFLRIIGKETYRSAWSDWEARKAVELKKKLVAVKTDSINNSPASLQRVGASWSTMFTFDSVKNAIDRA